LSRRRSSSRYRIGLEAVCDNLDPHRFLTALKGMGVDHLFCRPGQETRTLASLRRTVAICAKCDLSRTRKSVVFGEGADRANLVFIGEAPGEEEDLQGRPFVGRAGRLLDQLITRTGLSRGDVFICNVLKCRPPGNRDPQTQEIEACKAYLLDQIDLIQPKAICVLGRHAHNTLFDTDERISKIRGQFREWHGITVIPTFHPSFLLRNDSHMGEALGDMEKLRQLLETL
jgi:uracil-DNA glycosylase